MEPAGLRTSRNVAPFSGTLAGGAMTRGGGGSSTLAGSRPQARQPHPRAPPSLVPEGLPARGVIEPLSSLAYLQHRSPFAFAPGFELPLPALSLPPRLAAYPLKKRLICGQQSDGTVMPSAIDAATAQQLLTPFDTAGLLPTLVNPLGYPRLQLDPPLPPSCFSAAGDSAAASQQHPHRQQQKRPLPSVDSIKHCLEGLHRDDVALVLDVLPEVPDNLRRSLRQRLEGGPGPLRGTPGSPSDPGGSDSQRSARQPQQRAVLRHPSKPHLTAKRVLRILPHPSASGVSLVHVGLDVPATEAKTLGFLPSPLGVQKQQQEQQGQQKGKQQSFSWALLLPNGGTGAEATNYALYVRDAQKEAVETPAKEQATQQLCSYSFRRDYVWQPSAAAAGGAAGAERAVVLVVPPFPGNDNHEGDGPEEEECLMLQLAGPRRVLLKAGASKRRPRVVAHLTSTDKRKDRNAEPEGNEEEAVEQDTDDEEEVHGDGELRGRRSPEAAGEKREDDKEEGRHLFNEEAGEEEEEATSGSGSSSSSTDEDTSSESSPGNED